ncbi:MAG: redoxin domain-containing protein [Verrucomicrobiales bacterium]
MPDVHFPITTAKGEAVQTLFDQGVGQLHSFWYFEAERTFRQAAKLDPDCAMLYWGMAMANVNNDGRAGRFIAEAEEKKGSASKLEQLHIEALANFYRDEKKDKKERLRDLVRDLETAVQDFPDDIESRAFLIQQIWRNDSYHGIKITSHQAVDALLDQLFAQAPNHPAHHYRIHLWDGEKPIRAVKSAALCGATGPGIAHLWHMPGHTYSKLKRYRDAAWQQEASARVDHAHMMRDRVLPDQIHNFAHNNEWLTRDLMHLGRAKEAVALARNMIELPRIAAHIKVKDGKQIHEERGSSWSYGRDRLWSALEKFELWDDMIDLGGSAYLAPEDGDENEEIKMRRNLGAAWFEKGDATGGRNQIALLEGGQRKAEAERDRIAAEAEEKANADNKEGDELKKIVNEAKKGIEATLKAYAEALEELRCYDDLAEGRLDSAKDRAGKLKGVPKWRHARLHLRAGNAEEAIKLAKQAADGGKMEVVPQATNVEILWAADKKDEAKAAVEELRAAAAWADPDLAIFARIAPIAKELGFGDDWRAKGEIAADFGERPSLDSLGPKHWSPTPAPDFEVVKADRSTVKLGDFSGKPTVVIFYLGHQCSHCIEQLTAFKPLAAQYEAAGIQLLAISLDGPDELAQAGDYPFPLAADPELKAFKAYRAFDDFENLGLHGTFLIDGSRTHPLAGHQLPAIHARRIPPQGSQAAPRPARPRRGRRREIAEPKRRSQDLPVGSSRSWRAGTACRGDSGSACPRRGSDPPGVEETIAGRLPAVAAEIGIRGGNALDLKRCGDG